MYVSYSDFDDVFEKYDEDNDPVGAFAYLLNKLEVIFQEEDFTELQKACKLRGALFSSDFKKEIQAANNSDDILDVLDNFKINCNLLNTRYLKIIVRNVNIPKAERLIASFEEHFYCKMVSDVRVHINSNFFDKKHVENVEIKINTNRDTLTVRKLTDYCRKLESNMKLQEGTMSPVNSGRSGCLLLACAMPVHCSLYAYEMSKSNSFIFRQWHVRFIQIKSYPKIFTFTLSDNVEALPVTTSKLHDI